MLSVITKIIASILGALCILAGQKLKNHGIDTGDLFTELAGYSMQIAAIAVGAAYKWYLERKQPPKSGAPEPGIWKGQQLLILLPLLLVMGGCQWISPPNELYVKADRATFEAIAPEYRGYVEKDLSLTIDQQQRRYRTIETWRLRIESGERAISSTQPSK